MHIIWNSIKFFTFSFFMYGAAFGMLYLGLRDIISYNMFLFGKTNLDENNTTYVLPKKEAKEFIRYCLYEEKADYSAQLGNFPYNDINTFFKNFYELNTLFQKYENSMDKFDDVYIINKNLRNLEIDTADSTDITGPPIGEGISVSLPKEKQSEMINKLKLKLKNINDAFDISKLNYENGNFIDSFDCGFLKSDIAMVYNSLYDLSIESRILCILSCCIAFFGEISTFFIALLLFEILLSPSTIVPSINVAFNFTLSKDTGKTFPFIARTSPAFNIALSKPPQTEVSAVRNKFPKE